MIYRYPISAKNYLSRLMSFIAFVLLSSLATINGDLMA